MFAGNLLEGQKMARLWSRMRAELRMGCKPKSENGNIFVFWGGYSEERGLVLTGLSFGLLCRAWSWSAQK